MGRSRLYSFRSLALSVLPLVLAVSQNPLKSPPSWFWGCWTITAALPVSAGVGLSPKQEKAIIGTMLAFTRTCARSGRVVLKTPQYSTRTISAGQFFRFGNYVDLRDIGVTSKRVTEVEVSIPRSMSDLDFPGNYLYLRPAKKDIVISVEGDYFVAERKSTADKACKCELTSVK